MNVSTEKAPKLNILRMSEKPRIKENTLCTAFLRFLLQSKTLGSSELYVLITRHRRKRRLRKGLKLIINFMKTR